MSKILGELHRGSYQNVLDQMITLSRPKSADWLALVGAQSFLGHIDEAMQLASAHRPSFSANQQIQAHFYLGVALTRVSRFKEARRLFSFNMQNAKTANSLAFAYQGAGFYCYFRGEFDRALRFSGLALRYASKGGQNYIEFLAMDLLGHSAVQAGQRSRGLRLIESASRLALARGNQNFATAFNHARLIYHAEVGLDPHGIVNALNTALSDSQLSDSYTRANLVLELARQLTLRGQFNKAKDHLNGEATQIYANGNRRQEVMLQLRLAEIAFRQGDRHTMTHLLQSAKKTLIVLADRTFENRWAGLWDKLSASPARNISGPIDPSPMARSSGIHRQILWRQSVGVDPKTPIGEDPLHDLLQNARSNRIEARQQALNLGYLSVYQELSGIACGSSFLQVRDQGLILGSPQQITYTPMRITALQIKLIHCLLQGCSKEQLITQMWGYSYDPLRHDSLAHGAIAKLRKTFGAMSPWIVTTEAGWHLDRQVVVLWELPGDVSQAPDLRSVRTPQREDLNFRQLRALKKIPHEKGWSVATYRSEFQVSTMTAFRDLKYLHVQGLVVRTGKGRACRYFAS